MTSDEKFSVLYSNGLKLENALLEASDSEIHIYLYWTDRPEWEAIYSYSTRIFDAAGAKVQQGDFVIGHSPLAYHRLDKSALTPGAYALKLIVYDYETGFKASGLVVEDQSEFDHQLELLRFTIN